MNCPEPLGAAFTESRFRCVQGRPGWRSVAGCGDLSLMVEVVLDSARLELPYYSLSARDWRVMVAMGAGIADHIWTIEEILVLMDAAKSPRK